MGWRLRRFTSAFLTTACLALVPSVAAAQEAKSNTTQGEAKDIVRLKNGGLLRGTISELIPGESVTLVTVTGKVKEFRMDEVAYAGPAAEDPKAKRDAEPEPKPERPERRDRDDDDDRGGERVRPYVTVDGELARLKLESDPPGATFFRQSATAEARSGWATARAVGYERLCTAPCNVSMPAGTEVLALSFDRETPREAKPVTLPAGRSTVTGSLDSRAGLRTAGWLIAVGSLAAGSVLVVTSFGDEQTCTSYGGCYDSPQIDLVPFTAGLVILGAGIPIGIMLGVQRDGAKIDVEEERDRDLPRRTQASPGLTLNGKF
jgi:hypothetical protein